MIPVLSSTNPCGVFGGITTISPGPTSYRVPPIICLPVELGPVILTTIGLLAGILTDESSVPPTTKIPLPSMM
ncbi:hypothetical protein [Ginsengibacter hankyongi]|uniref:hypothetical protein n=1 Tax=Ginsengibacter hankyongi TaxID=2607284 RepID=UPI001F1BD94E|nr:hypothetical protein [Ginsengibacter hankyongi]